jgi:hypothetical protein
MLNVKTASLLQIAAYLETGEPSARLLEERLVQLHHERMGLLDVLKDLLCDLDTVDSHALNETVLPIWEDIERAKAIIAKAEGA